MFDWVGFDADDTLWENEWLYREAKEAFAALISGGSDPESVISLLDQIEVRNIELYGYGIKSFGLSMMEAALRAAADRLEADMLLGILEIAKRMLTAEVSIVEHAEATLAEISKGYDLILITKGDHFEQERKIRRSGLESYFQAYEVVSEKTEEAYRIALAKHGIDPSRFLMVGNSLRSDVLPVLALGARAVYIPHSLTWSHEHPSSAELEGAEYVELDSIDQLPAYLESLVPD